MKRRIHQRTTGEKRVAGGRQLTLEFHAGDSPPVPAALLLPETACPAPGALLIHGCSSRKEHMAERVGRVLLRHGIASLAIDLPLHGTRRDPEAQQAVGYSLGSFLGTLLAAEERSVRALVVAGGGDLPSGIPFGALERTVRRRARTEGDPLVGQRAPPPSGGHRARRGLAGGATGLKAAS